MSKPAKKPIAKIRSPRPRAAQLQLQAKAISSNDGKQPLEKTSKQARVIDMLRSTDGTPIASVMKLTGWQQHSVRGFLAGVVKKKLGLKLSSETKDGVRHYRLLGDHNDDASASKRKLAR